MNINEIVENAVNERNISPNAIALNGHVGVGTVYKVLRGGKVKKEIANRILSGINNSKPVKKKQPKRSKDAMRKLDFFKIEQMLKEKGWSNPGDFFVENAGLSEKYWSNVTKGQVMGNSILFGLASYLGIDREELFIEEQDKEETTEQSEIISNYSQILELLKSNNLMLQRIMKEFDIE